MTNQNPAQHIPDPTMERLTARVDCIVGELARPDEAVVQIGANALYSEVISGARISCSKRTVYEAVYSHPLVERRDSGLCWIYPTVEAHEAFLVPEIVVLAGPELRDILNRFHSSHRGDRYKGQPRKGQGRNW
jgi:hypothetical protein